MITKGQMNQASLAGRHGRELIRNAGLQHAFRCHLGGQPQFLLPGCAVAAAIKAGLAADTETIAAVETWKQQVGV